MCILQKKNTERNFFRKLRDDCTLNEMENVENNVKIFIDCSVVEVFIGNQQCLAVRVYPSLEDSKGLSVKSYGGKAEILNLDVWEMKSIYKNID